MLYPISTVVKTNPAFSNRNSSGIFTSTFITVEVRAIEIESRIDASTNSTLLTGMSHTKKTRRLVILKQFRFALLIIFARGFLFLSATWNRTPRHWSHRLSSQPAARCFTGHLISSRMPLFRVRLQINSALYLIPFLFPLFAPCLWFCAMNLASVTIRGVALEMS